MPSDLRTTEAALTEEAERERDSLRKNMRTDDERRRLEADLQNELKKLMETEMVSVRPLKSLPAVLSNH